MPSPRDKAGGQKMADEETLEAGESQEPEEITEPEKKDSSEISWDEATKSGAFVTLEEDTEKNITVTNWRFEKRDSSAQVAANEIEFISDVLVEDGEEVKDKLFTTTSKRLKTKLRPIFEGKDISTKISLRVMKVGKSFDTQFAIAA